MTRFFSLLSLAVSVSALGAVSTANAASDEVVPYACGTTVVGGAFYSDTGTQVCAEGRSDVEITPETKGRVFCMYNAQCTPLTPRLRRMVLEQTGKTNWSKLSDNDINHAVIKVASDMPVEVTQVAVQCLGSKTRNGNPDCPGVNDCVNDRKNAQVAWRLRPLNVSMTAPKPEDSEGFQLEKTGNSAPRGVVK